MSRRLMEAKRPIAPLAGPYGHPFHPIFVTVPIGAWVCSFVFDLVSRLADRPLPFVRGAYWLIAIGIVGALAAAVFGLMDLMGIPTGTRAFRTGLIHMILNVGIVVAYAVNFMIRRSDPGGREGVDIAMIAFSALTLGVLAVSGWLGGMLAYRYGVRVADEPTQEAGYRP